VKDSKRRNRSKEWSIFVCIHRSCIIIATFKQVSSSCSNCEDDGQYVHHERDRSDADDRGYIIYVPNI